MPGPARSSSTSAPMATTARIAPTSSCRARPIPRSPASTSTPRAARRSPIAPASRRARRARTGRSSARCRTCSARSCRFDLLAQLRQALFKAVPHLMRLDQIEAGKADDVKTLAGRGGSLDKAAFEPAIDGFLPDQPDRAGIGGDGRMLAPRLRADADGSGVSVSDGEFLATNSGPAFSGCGR